ncbi:MAG: MBL fold metallo-hydrolase [Alphaproteobacteria bacterium]
MKAKITVLGSGNSTGVPAIGNYWGACDPAEPRNRRTRCSLAVQSETTTLVIDTGPDFREQLNSAGISMIDAVLYTHAHGDHINGIDELRTLGMRAKKLMPIYANKWSLDDLEVRFHYLFRGGKSEIYPPILESHLIDEKQFGKPVQVGDIIFTPFDQDHGTCNTVGFRFGDFGYSVDICDLDGRALETLKGIKTWIVDGAGYKSTTNKVHAGLEKIYELNEKIGAVQVYITSLSLAMDYRILKKELRDGYEPAYDGLAFEIDL